MPEFGTRVDGLGTWASAEHLMWTCAAESMVNLTHFALVKVRGLIGELALRVQFVNRSSNSSLATRSESRDYVCLFKPSRLVSRHVKMCSPDRTLFGR